MRHTFLILFCLTVAYPSYANLVPNGGFETGAEAIQGWQVGRKPIPAGEDGVSGDKNTTVYWKQESDGQRYLLQEGSGSANDYALASSDKIPLLPNQKYQISFKYKAEGLMQENGDRSQYAAAIMDLFITQPGKGRIGGCRIITHTNTRGWSTLKTTNQHQNYFVTPDLSGCYAQVRLQLVNKYSDNKVTIHWDDVTLLPMDPDLSNAGFEEGETTPANWRKVGAAKTKWVTTLARSGKRAVSVTDAPDGLFSGWMTEIPVRPDRKYVFGGSIKGGDLNPNGFIGGGAVAIAFFDSTGSPVGKPMVSPAVGAETEWTEVKTEAVQPPKRAVSAQLTVGMKYCNGTAWFDDLFLEVAKAAAKDQVFISRQVPAPSAEVTYAVNLLKNGDLEEGDGNTPRYWRYVGKSTKDWTPEEVKEFHTNGRPKFSVGRGKGVWSTEVKYAGGHSLLNVSIDPPLSPNHQWYGRNPVDGYWLSDPMPCQAGKAYLAGGWIRPGLEFGQPWVGPLLLAFYDKDGREVRPKNNIRVSMLGVDPGEWTYWATQPSVAPNRAVTMRLKFIQELKADKGGWGRTYADNLAVWETPPGAQITGLNHRIYRKWFTHTHRLIKPPYTASPDKSPEYVSVWGKVQNGLMGNLFNDPDTPTVIRLQVANLLGEKRQVQAQVLRTDWVGEGVDPITTKPVEVEGFSEKTIEVELPPTNSYGAFHLEVTVTEGKAQVGKFAGRYGVLPPLNRPRTAENIWAITPLSHFKFDGSQHEMELGQLLKIAGFGKSWIRIYFNCSPYDSEKVSALIAKVKREAYWYRALGIKPILQIFPPHLPNKYPRQVDTELYKKVGEIIGREFSDLCECVGNWGIEQANSASGYRGDGNLRVTDTEYDTILASIYDGIKSVAPDFPVMIGNIATDFEAKTIRRLYKAPANGKFDGAFFNAYMGQLMVGQNMIKAFDQHGDTDYTIYSEEQNNQSSPYEGEARRYGEADGAKNMVRTWLSLAGKLHPRIKAVTIWGFAPGSATDIMMMTPDLQPRPQYVAHAVMADALADASFVADRSTDDISIFEWQRGDGPIFVAWANSGKRSITLEVAAESLTVMDLMGNCQKIRTNSGLVTLDVTSMPRYFFGGGTVSLSKRVVISLSNGTRNAGKPQLAVAVKSNNKERVTGMITVFGTGEKIEQSITLDPEETKQLVLPIQHHLPDSKRSSFRAEVALENGAVFAAIGEFAFAQAVKASSPPAINGTWQGWEDAQVITFGGPGQVRKSNAVGEKYTGQKDIMGKLRLLWDDQHLYLGVQSFDDVFLPNPKRGDSGFMGDSIEFGIQPDNIVSELAPKYEYELFLPGDGKYAASRRFPAPRQMVTHWNASVTPTGNRGDAIYQVAIPWKDLGISGANPGKTFSLSVVLNDKDNSTSKFGARDLIHWFSGVHTAKNPEKYGDVVLVEP